MTQCVPFILLVAILLTNPISYCSAENVYCATPTIASCSSCPQNSTKCTTLSEYAQEANLYFISNTTIVFLPGDHVLNTNITVANVTRLTMHGESSSDSVTRVVCNGSVGLDFKSMVDLKISSLIFASCSRKYNTSNFSRKYNTINFLLPRSYALRLQSTQYAELVKCSFKNNVGTALLVDNTDITYAEEIEFTYSRESRSCTKGRGITAFHSNLTFTGNTTFFENCAYDGGAIYASNNTVLIFEGTSNFIRNSAGSIGGAIYTSQTTLLLFNGTSNFIGNTALFSSGAIYTRSNCTLTFYGTINFIDNSAGDGGAIYASYNTVLSFNGASNFIGNSAVYGGAIRIDVTSTLILNGTVNFTSNGHNRGTVNGDATYGGGLYMAQKTALSILPNTTVYWEKNHASYGGAIFVRDAIPLSYCTSFATYIPKEDCFFQLPGQNLSSGIDAQFVFKNNSADAAGSVLYGGAVDNCKLTGLESCSSGKVFDMLVHIEDDNTNSSVSSDPFHICPCENNHSDCSVSSIYYTAFPGETFQFSIVGVGQRNGTVPAAVRGTLNPSYEYFQQTNNTCTTLNNTVFSLWEEVTLKLYADGPCSTFSGILNLVLTINKNCPPGFVLSESARSCVCEQRLARFTNHCYITNGVGQITRDSLQRFWVGYDHQLDSQSDKLILHPFCPYDYCIFQTVVFPLNNSDTQCAFDRSGLLCGACKKGYSLVLGTSQCKHCTNGYLALLFPFALMGLALVFFLFVCQLTVASGTLSGLVFYANIVRVNRTIFLPVESTNAFSVFIAWLNLDFGIQVCFYNGMDAYSKTWLQFVFPVYVWMIVGLIIVASNFSQKFAKLLGNNPVSVLATLILLSYTKILRTLIAVIHVTYLEYPTYNRRVWLFDANIDYLVGKHIPLFLVAVLVLLFLFLPYTLLLLFGQWLQAISHFKLFSWVNSARIKPFMDSYHAPYKAKHRYWPGLLLILRLVLFLAFSLNSQQDTSNLLAIIVGTATLQFWAWGSAGVYRNCCLNVLEGSFALNLIILAAATYHVNQSGGNQLAVGYTSVSIAFVTFIGIFAYHICQQLRHTKLCRNIQLKLGSLNTVIHCNDPVNNPVDIPRVEDAHFDHLREPLLENHQPLNYGTS